MKSLTLFAYLLLYIHHAKCVDKELTINVDPRKEDCFYQNAKNQDVIDVEYQVIDGGHGDLDITFHLVDPTGRILVADFKKSENNHQVTATMDGDYKFCFDNTFSSYNAKTVFFELLIDSENEDDWGSDENIDFKDIKGDDVYELKVQDIQAAINAVRSHLTKARHLQDMIKSSEAKDRNIAEENCFKVFAFSLVQVIIMIGVGLIQVIMVRSLFDDNSKVHKIWKGFDSSR